MGRCFSVWVGIHLTNKWTAKAKAVLEHTLPLSIQTSKLTLTSRLAEFLNNPVPKDSKTSIAFRIALQSESSIFQQIITNHDVLLIKHHNKSQGFHGCTLQAVISTQQTPGKPTKNWITPTGKGNSLNHPPKKHNINCFTFTWDVLWNLIISMGNKPWCYLHLDIQWHKDQQSAT